MNEPNILPCPICNRSSNVVIRPENLIHKFNCPVCGKYSATREFFDDKTGVNDENRHIISGILKQRTINNDNHIILLSGSTPKEEEKTNFTIDELLQTVFIPENPIQQIDKFIENFGNLTKNKKGKYRPIDPPNEYPLSYSRDKDDFLFIIQSVIKLGYLETFDNAPLSVGKGVRLSVEGWQKVEELKQKNKESKQVFIACRFHDDHDQFIKAIERGIERNKEKGYKAICIKEKQYSETILDKAFGEIRKSRFVVVDLTGQRPSVFVEAGFTMGLGIEIIFVASVEYKEELKKEKESIEFYTSQYKINFYEDKEHLEEIIARAVNASF